MYHSKHQFMHAASNSDILASDAHDVVVIDARSEMTRARPWRAHGDGSLDERTETPLKSAQPLCLCMDGLTLHQCTSIQ